MTPDVLDQFARDHAVILSVCQGMVGEPCGEVYGGMSIDPKFAGVTHGIGPCHVAKLAAARAEWLAQRVA